MIAARAFPALCMINTRSICTRHAGSKVKVRTSVYNKLRRRRSNAKDARCAGMIYWWEWPMRQRTLGQHGAASEQWFDGIHTRSLRLCCRHETNPHACHVLPGDAKGGLRCPRRFIACTHCLSCICDENGKPEASREFS